MKKPFLTAPAVAGTAESFSLTPFSWVNFKETFCEHQKGVHTRKAERQAAFCVGKQKMKICMLVLICGVENNWKSCFWKFWLSCIFVLCSRVFLVASSKGNFFKLDNTLNFEYFLNGRNHNKWFNSLSFLLQYLYIQITWITVNFITPNRDLISSDNLQNTLVFS